MTALEHALARAALEYMKNGMINTSLVMELGVLGVDVPALEKRLEQENN